MYILRYKGSTTYNKILLFCKMLLMHNKNIRFTHALLFYYVSGWLAIATGHSCYTTFHELHSSGKYLRSFHVLQSIISSYASQIRRTMCSQCAERESVRLCNFLNAVNTSLKVLEKVTHLSPSSSSLSLNSKIMPMSDMLSLSAMYRVFHVAF